MNGVMMETHETAYLLEYGWGLGLTFHRRVLVFFNGFLDFLP